MTGKSWWVVIDVHHGYLHRDLFKADWVSTIARSDHKGVGGALFPVQLGGQADQSVLLTDGEEVEQVAANDGVGHVAKAAAVYV